MLCKLIMKKGKAYSNVTIPGDSMQDVREWLNGGKEPGTSLAKFINVGDKAVVNTDQIISVVRDQ